jgi:hypothetical protein
MPFLDSIASLSRGTTVIPDVVTFAPSDFQADITKEEGSAKFFVIDDTMKIATNTVILSGPFCGKGADNSAAQLLLAHTRSTQLELSLLVVCFVTDRMNWFEYQAMQQAEEQCVRAFRQLSHQAWEQAELSLLEGLRQLTPLSRWAPDLVAQAEGYRQAVSELLLAEEGDRERLERALLLSLSLVGDHASKT